MNYLINILLLNAEEMNSFQQGVINLVCFNRQFKFAGDSNRKKKMKKDRAVIPLPEWFYWGFIVSDKDNKSLGAVFGSSI